MVIDLKSIGCHSPGGSNPPLSAIFIPNIGTVGIADVGGFCFCTAYSGAYSGLS